MVRAQSTLQKQPFLLLYIYIYIYTIFILIHETHYNELNKLLFLRRA
jgi:hypothetical protein